MSDANSPLRFSPQFEIVTDTSVADWVRDALWPWGREGVRVGSCLPDSFEAYARIPHWEPGLVSRGPEGVLLHEQIVKLTRLLEGFTRERDTAWLCFWVGYGDWMGSTPLVEIEGTTSDGRRKVPGALLGAKTPARTSDRELAAIPQLRTQGRQYFIFRGSLSTVPSFEIDGRYQSPSIWWPQDRAWCVATEVDARSTYVGGVRECIDAILGLDALGAVEVGTDAFLE